MPEELPASGTVVIVSEGGKVNIREGNGLTYGRITQLAPGHDLPVCRHGRKRMACRGGRKARRLGVPGIQPDHLTHNKRLLRMTALEPYGSRLPS